MGYIGLCSHRLIYFIMAGGTVLIIILSIQGKRELTRGMMSNIQRRPRMRPQSNLTMTNTNPTTIGNT